MIKSETKEPLKVALAGLGTVGIGVVKILQQNADVIAARAGRAIEIVGVSSRDRHKQRGVDLTAYKRTEDSLELLNEDIDVLVEMIGGENGIAKDLCEGALGKGVSVVTANKALLAHHGLSLASMAESHNAILMYEAAVAGGIPIIKALREGFAANDIKAVYGILNGTCNYILTEMRLSGRDFEDVLKDAQDKGYAEADPAFDVEGVDAAHKLCLLTALAFGVKPDFQALSVKGIDNVTATDIEYARELGYRIKLLGMARRVGGKISQTVEPCFVSKKSTMGAVDGVFNAVYVEGDFVDTGLLIGPGAGEGPTASAVVSDLIDLARGVDIPAFGVPSTSLQDAEWVDQNKISSRFYIHVRVSDRPGVLAEISSVLKDYDVSIEAMLQRGNDPENPVSIVMTAHEIVQENLDKALEKISELDCVLKMPTKMRIVGL